MSNIQNEGLEKNKKKITCQSKCHLFRFFFLFFFLVMKAALLFVIAILLISAFVKGEYFLLFKFDIFYSIRKIFNKKL